MLIPQEQAGVSSAYEEDLSNWTLNWSAGLTMIPDGGTVDIAVLHCMGLTGCGCGCAMSR